MKTRVEYLVECRWCPLKDGGGFWGMLADVLPPEDQDPLENIVHDAVSDILNV